MKLTISPDVLAGVTAWAAQALPKRPAIPVLAGIRLDATTAGSGCLGVSAFDYETGAQAQADAGVDEPGTVIIPGRMFTEVTRNLPAKDVHIAAEGSRVSLTCGPASFTFMSMPVEDYPSLPAIPSAAGTLGSEAFAHAVAQVGIAAGRDDTLPALTGICLEPGRDTLTLAATDRYRLATVEVDWDAVGRDLPAVIFPAQALQAAAKGMTAGQTVTLALERPDYGEGMAGLTGGDRTLVTRLIGGEFPRYRALLPGNQPMSAQVDVGTLADVVKRAALVAERNTAIHLHFTPGSLRVTAGTGDEAAAEETMDATWDGGEPFTIAFNPHYLLDALTATGDAAVRFGFTSAGKPALITPAGGGSYLHVLMPVRPGS